MVKWGGEACTLASPTIPGSLSVSGATWSSSCGTGSRSVSIAYLACSAACASVSVV